MELALGPKLRTTILDSSKKYMATPSAAKEWKPYIIESDQWPLAILNDIHFPYHDEDLKSDLFEVYNLAIIKGRIV
jgi:hypothetical protein